MTEKEWAIIYDNKIRMLERHDRRAAELMREMQEKGSLVEQDFYYKEAKRKELEKIIINQFSAKHAWGWND